MAALRLTRVSNISVRRRTVCQYCTPTRRAAE
jgi:hypothetical protein